MAAAITSILGRQLASPCRVYSSDLRVRVLSTGLAASPDVTVICGPSERDPESATHVTNVHVIARADSPALRGFGLITVPTPSAPAPPAPVAPWLQRGPWHTNHRDYQYLRVTRIRREDLENTDNDIATGPPTDDEVEAPDAMPVVEGVVDGEPESDTDEEAENAA